MRQMAQPRGEQGGISVALLTCLHPLHMTRHPGSQSLNVRGKLIFPSETV